MNMGYTERWISRNHVQLWTEAFGSHKNPAVVLIVGAGAISTFYPDNFCREMAEVGFYVIRYDQRDYGKSTKFTQIQPEALSDPQQLKNELPYRIEDLVEDLRAIIDGFQISKAHIVGHSMGGMIAQLFTARYPEHLLSFTSISVAPASHKFDLEPIPEKTMQKILENSPVCIFEKDIDGWLASLKLLNGSMEFDETAARNYVKEIYARDPGANVAWNHIGIQHLLPDHLDQFHRNKVRGLILHGEEDPLQPISYAYVVQKIISNTKLVTLPRVGHMFFNQRAQHLILMHLLQHFKNT